MSETSKKTNQIVGSIIITLGGFACGSIIGWASPSEKYLKKEYGKDASWIQSIMPAGAALVMLPMPFILKALGRRTLLLIISPICAVCWILLVKPFHLAGCILGRILTGMCAGIYSNVCPLYTAEIAEPAIRGMVGVFFQLQITMGILWAYCFGLTPELFYLTLACMIGPILLTVCLIFIHEAPIALLHKKKTEAATKSLQFYRGKDFNISSELQMLTEEVQAREQNADSGLCVKMKMKHNYKALIMSFTLMVIQQLSGINAVIFYSEKIFGNKSVLSGEQSSIVIAAVQVFATAPSALLVEKAGRKIMMGISLALMMLSLILLGIYFGVEIKGSNWIPILALCVYIIGFSIGTGPLPWVLMGELFSPDVKDKLSPIAAFTNWGLAFVVSCTYPFLDDAINGWTFLIFAVFCLLGILFLFYLIETKQKTLEQIQEELNK